MIFYLFLVELCCFRVFSAFSPFSYCFSVVLQLDKGDYPENAHAGFCPNKKRSFEAFMCLEFVLER